MCIKPVVDSLLLISKKQSANFNWDEKCVKEISIMLADSAFEIQKTNSLANGTKKRNKTEVAIFKTFSPIYLNKNEFLILISESRGETNGSNCLFSYELKNEKWTQKRLIYCFYS